MSFKMPAGILKDIQQIVKQNSKTNTENSVQESISLDDFLDAIRFLSDYILAQRKEKNNRKNGYKNKIMNTFFDLKLAEKYNSNSQKIRILTEAWVGSEIYCPNCGDKVENYTNNKPVADFYCKKCSEDFELKSKKGKIGKKVSAGAYSQMIKRINSPQNPHFFFMGYLATFSVNDFFVVPKYFFVPEIIEKRKALSENARRAGWIGSNILFYKIPDSGKIFYVENGMEIAKAKVLEKWQKTAFLKKIKGADLKGWILDIMNCIESLGKKEFSLQDIYNFEKNLAIIHPENKNIKPKIRQQLQFLRDKGYLKFIEPGKYKLT